MGFFSFVKKIGRGLKNGIKTLGRVAHKGFDYAKKGVNWVRKQAGRVAKIPVIGDIAKNLVNTPIPLIGGLSAKQVFNKVNNVVDRGHSIASGADNLLNNSSREQQNNFANTARNVARGAVQGGASRRQKLAHVTREMESLLRSAQ